MGRAAKERRGKIGGAPARVYDGSVRRVRDSRASQPWEGSATVVYGIVYWRIFVVWCTRGNTALWLA